MRIDIRLPESLEAGSNQPYFRSQWRLAVPCVLCGPRMRNHPEPACIQANLYSGIAYVMLPSNVEKTRCARNSGVGEIRCGIEMVLSDEFELVSVRPVRLSFTPRKVRATRQEQRYVSA